MKDRYEVAIECADYISKKIKEKNILATDFLEDPSNDVSDALDKLNYCPFIFSTRHPDYWNWFLEIVVDNVKERLEL